MTLVPWDIDRFPLKTGARTPGQRDADRWLNENPEDGMRAVQPGDLDRLTREHEPDPRDRFFGVPTGGGGHVQETYTPYGNEGYNQENRRYPGDERGEESSGYHIPGVTHPWDEDDDDERREPSHYHVVTRPVGSENRDEWTEHPYVMFEHPDEDHDPDSAWQSFEEDNPEYGEHAGDHEVVDVHPADEHDTWHNQLNSEEEDFAKIAPHGLRRENSDFPGHRAYRYEDPNGGVHRLWHNHTTFSGEEGGNGPGWRTSYHDPGLPEGHAQMKWSFHPDSLDDSLGSALNRFQRNKSHSDIAHSGTGFAPVENAYGHHYVSRRPGGSTHQLLYNTRGGNGDNSWSVTHYSPDTLDMHTTEHGNDLAGALDQAKRNLARG